MREREREGEGKGCINRCKGVGHVVKMQLRDMINSESGCMLLEKK